MKNYNDIQRINIVRYAYQNIRFYQKLAEQCKMNMDEAFDWNVQWDKLPVVSREMISNRMADLLDPRYVILENTPKMQSVFTSGTTGTCIQVSWLLEDIKTSLMPLWMNRYKRYNILPSDRLCTFYSARRYGKEDNWYRYSGNELAFAKENINEEKLSNIYSMLVENKIKWIIIQPSILGLLYSFIVKNNLPIWDELSYIEVTGEYMQESFYKKARQLFNIPILNQYGTYEVNTIAYGEGTGYLDVMSSNVYVEVVDEKGNILPDGIEGKICVTSLSNKAMPFVRYLTGDRGKIRAHVDNAGRKIKQVCLTKARCLDMIYLEGGMKVNPYVLQKAIEVANHIMDDEIIQFRFVQTAYDEIHVELVVYGDYIFDKVCQCIRDHIYQDELKEVNFYFERKEYMIQRDDKEKCGWFYSDIKPEKTQ